MFVFFLFYVCEYEKCKKQCKEKHNQPNKVCLYLFQNRLKRSLLHYEKKQSVRNSSSITPV